MLINIDNNQQLYHSISHDESTNPTNNNKQASILSHATQLCNLPEELKCKIAVQYLDADSYGKLRTVNKSLHEILPSFQEISDTVKNSKNNTVIHYKKMLDELPSRKIKHAYTTDLFPEHFPTTEQKKPMSDLLARLKSTDSPKETDIALADITTEMTKMLDDIFSMREDYFEIINNYPDPPDIVDIYNPCSPYGQLAEGYKLTDVHEYIRALIHFKEVREQTDIICTERELPPIDIQVLSSLFYYGVGGDFIALDSLMNGITKKNTIHGIDTDIEFDIRLPDLTYNRGLMQFG